MMKGDRSGKRSSFRKRLSDISNLQKQPIEEKALPCAMDYIEQLLEENKTLNELVGERNKTIASSAAQLKKIGMSYLKLQQQNRSLTQSNSRYLAELNFGREKLKALQHELICKDALLKATRSERKVDISHEKTVSKACKQGGEETTEQPLRQTNKHSNLSQRPISRSQSLGPTTMNQQAAEKEIAENKRHCLRRRSHSLKLQKHEALENLFEIEDAKFPIRKSLDGPICTSRREAQASERPSIERPLRKATEKVQSHKEVSVNVKMRRPDWAS